MIEQVEGIRSQLQFYGLCNVENPRHREIQFIDGKTSKRIASEISLPLLEGNRKSRRIYSFSSPMVESDKYSGTPGTKSGFTAMRSGLNVVMTVTSTVPFRSR